MTTGQRTLGGRYELGEILGVGGMAEVYRGRDNRLGRAVAVKLLRSENSTDPTFIARFRREAQSAASLNHANIVSIYDTGKDDTTPYIVMEYLEGRTLRDVLREEGPMYPRRALEVVAEVCSALAFSHAAGIIHRDIKPANVMLTSTGAIKVMDFGIARAMTTSVTMTQTAAVIGTAQYLSPEQARGDLVDARSDVYSTGCLLYELMTGRPPFVGDSPVTVALAHVREDPVPPSRFNRDVAPAVDAIVLKALAKHPGNRYQSADEMREDLQRAAAGRPVRATPVMTDDATHVMQAAAAAPPTAVLRRQDPERAPEGRNKRGAGYIGLGLALVAIFVIAALLLNNALKSSPRSKVTVPPLVGKTEAQALKLLTDNKLVLGNKSSKADNTGKVKKDLVLSQNPTVGASIDEGGEVDLVFSEGIGNVEVPEIVGLPLTEAQAALKLAGLRLNSQVVVEEKADAEPNEVLRVDPVEGIQVPANSEVKIAVASGDITVPQVTGLTLEKAQEQLEALGFRARIGPDEFSDEPPGTVVKQDPAPKTKQPRDSLVVLTRSSGPSPTPTPSPTPPVETTPAPTDTATATETATVPAP